MARIEIRDKTGRVVLAGDAESVKTLVVDAIADGASLAGAILRDADLRYVDFKSTDVSGADFGYASLIGADLTRARIDGATFDGADMTGTLMPGAGAERRAPIGEPPTPALATPAASVVEHVDAVDHTGE